MSAPSPKDDTADTAHGVVFPQGPDGRRSTSATGAAVWADAVRECDQGLADAVGGTSDWRKAYVTRVVEVTAAGTRTDKGAVALARAGLDSLEHRLRFARGGVDLPLADCVAQDGPALGTRTVRGTGDRVRDLVVPYRGGELQGEALRAQLRAWVGAGVVEPSFADAIERVVDHPDWLDLSDRAFAVLGAGAELGPVGPLLSWGAHVAAVDLPQQAIWDRLTALAEHGAGTLDVPVREDQPGADLLRETPEVARWLAGAAPDRPMAIGSYAYADGAKHVLVAAASDVVVQHLLAGREGTAYAELATPTDTYPVPLALVEDARARWAGRGWRAPLQRAVPGFYAPAYPTTVTRDDGSEVGIADVLVPQQGPNYTLAKRVQRWRATVAQADGHPVSANVAPSTRTRSVTSNRLLAAAYAGASTFGVEVFEPATSRVLMAALLVHDLRHPGNPAHPDDLFAHQAAHGGMWRLGYLPRSVLPLAALKGMPRTLLH
jgi:hypothetical protein